MKFLLLVAFLCCAGLTVATEQPVRYDNYRVYNVELTTNQQLKSFAELTKTLDLNTLSDFSRPGQTYQVAVPPSAVSIFEARSAALKVKFRVVIQELQKALESIFTRFDGILNPKLNWTHYHNLDTIYNWFDSRRLKFPLFIKPYIIGYSYEGRPIKAAKISVKKGNKAIFIESNIHAIEWITSATSTCFLNNLLHSGRPELLRLLIKYDWIFVPIANPDGFAYSHKINALWRKNRKPTGYTNSSGICYGVDLNRNFDFYWGESGYNVKEPCDHFYGGKAPHSEPESQALSRFILSFPPGYIRMYLALHSYGNLVLLPYGHSVTEFPPEYDQMMNISSGFTTAAEATHGTKFRAGASGLLLNIVSGAVKDFAYGVAKIPYSATIELRDRGQYGFFLPRDQIQPTCDEFTNGVIGLIAKAEELGLFK